MESENELELMISNNRCSYKDGSHFFTVAYYFVGAELLTSTPVVGADDDVGE